MVLTIQRLNDSQIEAAKAVVVKGCFEFFGQAPIDFEDMDRISSHYVEPSGIFLVLVLRPTQRKSYSCLKERTYATNASISA